ncbi:MAG: amidohydrolase family protein [Planctomycetota bacterium]
MKKHGLFSLLLCALSLALPGAVRGDETKKFPGDHYAVRIGELHTAEGEVLRSAVVVIQDGKFAAMGTDVKIPDGIPVVDLPSHTMIPGLIDAETTLTGESRDPSRVVSPEVLALDAWDYFADREDLLRGGVTTVYVSPGISTARGDSVRLISGRGAVIKTAGSKADPRRRVVNPSTGVQLTLGVLARAQPSIYDPPIGANPDNPFVPLARPLPQSRAGQYLALRQTFGRAKGYADGMAAYLAGKGALPDFNLEGSSLLGLFHKKDYLRVRASRAQDIYRIVEFAEAWGLKVVLESGADSAKLASFLAERKIPVVFPGAFLPGSVPREDLGQETTEGFLDERAFLELHAAGVPVVLHSPGDGQVKDLLLQAATAVGMGLTPKEALRSVTLGPAEILGVADRVGSIAVGKDADFVVLAGAPFSSAQADIPLAVIAGGEVVYEQVPKVNAETVVIRCGRILTGNGKTIVGGVILVKDGKVDYVGAGTLFGLDTKSAKKVVDASALTVMPGLIDAGSTVGTHVEQLNTPFRASSGTAGGSGASTFRLADSVNPNDPAFADLLRAGVTTVLIAPEVSRSRSRGAPSGTVINGRFIPFSAPRSSSSGSAIKGQISALKLAARDPSKAVFRKYAAMLFGSTSTSTVKKAKAYHDGWEKFEKAKKAAEAKGGKAAAAKLKAPTVVEAYEPFRALFRKEVPAILPASSGSSIESLQKAWGEAYGIKLAFYGLSVTKSEDFARVARAVRAGDSTVLLDLPFLVLDGKNRVNLPHEYTEAGAPIAFRSLAAGGGRFLPLQVAYAVRNGLGVDRALKAMTHDVAKQFGIADRVGTIAKGRDADLVFVSGEPFSLASEVQRVMVEGNTVYEVKR